MQDLLTTKSDSTLKDSYRFWLFDTACRKSRWVIAHKADGTLVLLIHLHAENRSGGISLRFVRQNQFISMTMTAD